MQLRALFSVRRVSAHLDDTSPFTTPSEDPIGPRENGSFAAKEAHFLRFRTVVNGIEPPAVAVASKERGKVRSNSYTSGQAAK